MTRQVFEWAVTDRGVELRRRLAALLEEAEAPAVTPAGVIVVAPGREHLFDDLLQHAATITAEARWIVRGHVSE